MFGGMSEPEAIVAPVSITVRRVTPNMFGVSGSLLAMNAPCSRSP